MISCVKERLCNAGFGETSIFHAYRVCETFADFSFERVKSGVTKHDDCDFLTLMAVSSIGRVCLAMVSAKAGYWMRAI